MYKEQIQMPPAVAALLERLEQAGFRAWAVGGCVRDSLLGLCPADWDICTTALPGQIKQVFADRRTILTGEKHGTVTVLWQGSPCEVTTLRAESGYSDHRHPDVVCFVENLEQDLARRDFTINAMACGKDGLVVDLYGGKEDLRRGIIRCVGDPEQRFSEDALRILRALRFSARFGFLPEQQTAAAAQALAPSLGAVSAERVYKELDGILAGEHAAQVLEQFPAVLAAVIPEIGPAIGFDQCRPAAFAGDLWKHITDAFSLAGADRYLRWALMLHDLGKVEVFVLEPNGQGSAWGHEAVSARMAEAALRRLKADNDTLKTVVELVAHHGDVPALSKSEALRWLHRFGPVQLYRLLEMKRCDQLARIQAGRVIGFLEELRVFKALVEQAEQEGCWRLDQLAVTGRDLLDAGFPGGPGLGAMLNILLEKVMDGELPNEKARLLEYAAACRQE